MSLSNLTFSAKISKGKATIDFPPYIAQNIRQCSLRCHSVLLKSSKRQIIKVVTNVSTFEGHHGPSENVLSLFYIDREQFSHNTSGRISVPVNKCLNKIEIVLENENGDVEQTLYGHILLEMRGVLM